MKIHTSISTLLQKNFIEVINTFDLKYLLVDFEDDLPDNAIDIWDSIQDQYHELIQDGNTKFSFNSNYKIHQMESRHARISSCLWLIIRGNLTPEAQDRCIELLKSDKIIIDLSKPIIEEIEKAQKRLKALESAIRIKKDQLPKQEEQTKVSFVQQCMQMKAHSGVDVDRNKCTVEEWYYLKKETSKMVKS